MKFAELFVRHRVLAYMMSLATLLFGVIGMDGLGIDRMPEIDVPLVLVTTVSPGSSPEVIDRSITNVLESSINAVSGIYKINSVSSPGVSQIVVEFKMDKDIDVAFNEVQSKINQVINDLPVEAEVPVLAKINPNATPVLWLVLQGDRSLAELNGLARDQVKKALETIPGVGEVVVAGGRERKMRVDLDLQRMAAQQVTVEDVIAAFAREHVQLPGGFLVGGMLEKLLQLDLEYHSAEALENLVVRWRGQIPVRLGEIARVSDSLDDMRSLARLNGEDGVAIAVLKVQKSNTVQIAHDIEQRLEEVVRPNLPQGVTLTLAVSEKDLIEGTVAGLQSHILEGTVLAALVVWLFLLNIPATVIISAAIPVSLAGSIFFMYFNDYTFNMFTLSALLLLIGVVVDDAIVVLENIHRQHEAGIHDPYQAAIKGTSEVVFAVVAASLTLVCIFASVIFMEGVIGVLLRSFAMVVTVGVLTSMLVSFSLTPALCARFLREQKHAGKSRVVTALGRWHERLERRYHRFLGYALAHRARVMLVATLITLSTGWFFNQLNSEMFPHDDDSRFAVRIEAPLGSSINYVLQKIQEAETVLRRHPEVRLVLSTVDSGAGGEVTTASLKALLTPPDQRQLSQNDVMAAVREELRQLPGVEVYVMRYSVMEGQGLSSQPLMAYIAGPDLDGVAKYSRLLYEKLRQHPGMGDLQLDLDLNRPLLTFDIDRERAHELGIDTQVIANTIRVLAGGADIAKYNSQVGDSERYDVRLAAQKELMQDPRDLEQVYLRTAAGTLVPLGAVAKIREEFGPATVLRANMSIAAGLSSTPVMGLGQATELLRDTAAEILPPGYRVILFGEADKLEETAAGITFVFITGLALVYMVLASQFNSFLQPLLVMLAQPLAIVGGIVALWITGHTLNAFSMIGLFLLVGLVSKNSILLVDLINRYRAQGMRTDQAIFEACPKRMRPVLMTSMTIVLAMLPGAIGVGEGSALYGPLSVAVIGGVISSTVLTLLVVPVAYSLLERWLEFRADAKARYRETGSYARSQD